LSKLPPTPAPELLKSVEPDIEKLEAGTRIWRIYNRRGPHPTAWNASRSFGPVASARFDHHEMPVGESDRGILYGATNPDAIATCVAESFQEDRTVNRRHREPWLVCFTLGEDVSLLSLRGKWPTRAGASMNINTSERRNVAQGWSRSIYEAYPNVGGLLYASSMNSNAPALALYERAEGALSSRPVFHRPLSDPALEDVLKRICRDIGYDFL
jgi:hypothetical protein